MLIRKKGEKIKVEDLKKAEGIMKYFGLMFRNSNTENLLFTFSKNGRHRFHSFFVFFPFLIVWLDEKNSIMEFKIARPFLFSIVSRKKFKKALEMPLNKKNAKVINFIVGRGKI